MGARSNARSAQEGRELFRVGQGMPSGLRRHRAGQDLIQMGKRGAGNMRCGKFLAAPVRAREIVPAIDDCQLRRRSGRAHGLRQLRCFYQVQWQICAHVPGTIVPTAL